MTDLKQVNRFYWEFADLDNYSRVSVQRRDDGVLLVSTEARGTGVKRDLDPGVVSNAIGCLMGAGDLIREENGDVLVYGGANGRETVGQTIQINGVAYRVQRIYARRRVLLEKID